MKRLFICLLLSVVCSCFEVLAGDGIPFVVNYFPESYHAHARNFDIISDGYGRVYVANFEGLLYYDQTKWQTIHFPGIFRATRLFKDSRGRIWVGGYNSFGYLDANKNGELQLNTLFSIESEGFLGEVEDIRERDGVIVAETSIGAVEIDLASLNGFTVEKKIPSTQTYYKGAEINKKIKLADGTVLLATTGKGLVILDKSECEIYSLSEENGLCSNNVQSLYADSLGYVWGATDNGIFLVNIRTAFTHFGRTEGLPGEVLSVCQTDGGLYVGTLRGLFVKISDRFKQLETIRHACWQIQQDDFGNLYACTAGGLFLIDKDKRVRQISDGHTLSVYVCGDGSYYTGEVDGIYRISSGKKTLLNTVEKALNMVMDSSGTLLAKNIYGQIFSCNGKMDNMTRIDPLNVNGEKDKFNNTLYQQDNEIFVLSHIGLFKWNSERQSLEEQENKEIWSSERQHPLYVYPETKKRFWMTDNEGKDLSVYGSEQEKVKLLNATIHPIHDLKISTMQVYNRNIWIGGNWGLICWNLAMRMPDYDKKISLYIRSAVMNNDSVVWGGLQSEGSLLPIMPPKNMSFENNIQNIEFSFSSNIFTTLGTTEYRYRFRPDEDWSAWSTNTSAKISNPRPGRYCFEVMARDRYGRIIDPVTVSFNVRYPLFLRWYSVLFYFLLLSGSIWLFIKWRMHRLLKEKLRLENIVEERTSLLRIQKKEIEEKTEKLEIALENLESAQYQLIRQEKMATVGTLTSGLVDRILNPMNYVTNFSHMSIGLAKDIKNNLEDDKEHMTPDVYDDSLDVVDMLSTNLQKIEEHGLNTTRILKAMEEMLKERTPHKVSTDLAAVCRKNIEMLQSYYSAELSEYHISVKSPEKDIVVTAEVDAELISKTIMSMLVNSVYALKKKYQRMTFIPEIRLNISDDKERKEVKIVVYDNGIGIEQSALSKIFDPFFTTKTTAEATGVGLYLSREIILDHGGNITVQSVKDEFTEFTITVPFDSMSDKNKN